MKILLLGGNGQVGSELRQRLPALGRLIVATRDGADADLAADLRQPEAVAAQVRALAPDVVVNAAAYTAVDRAETDAGTAFAVNAHAPAAIARACARSGALLVHYSTDYVFDGKTKRPCREEDATAPLQVYGASKLAGEQAIDASGARHCILRTSWVYAAHGHNFLRTLLRRAQAGEPLCVVDDQLGAPTPAHWLAEWTVDLLRQPPADAGIWHLSAAGQTSWHGFAEAIVADAAALGLLPSRPVVAAISAREWPAAARRPACSVLDTGKLHARFGIVPKPWQDGLREVLRQLSDQQS